MSQILDFLVFTRHLIDKKCCRHLNYLQNEPIMSKQ